jgi:hypothetical protein
LAKQTEEISSLRAKLDNQDKVMKEMKKQLGCYKNEVQAM